MSDEVKDPLGPFFKASTPDGRWVVQCSVEPPPEGAEGTWFGATVTLDDKSVTDSLVTDNPQKLLRWARQQMTEAMRRSTPTKEQS